ncbi:MAG: siroheme synthase CysG [Fluviicoccus sp.]|uniref:siroheme synthase CysG n=1 Tax=Fluviicoccus sp. TaxID=2003552 RepID=UPI002722530C|nr:siroheme synthase CysG [Fluviicoccus sp.]MDO8330637.1 siroheme synthase CysG [Fluviicoccus sp.]
MDFFPIFLKLNDQTCLVVGGGDVGLRKARLLRAAGAHVTVVSPELSPAMAAYVAAEGLHHRAETYSPRCLDGMRLVYAATDSETVNQTVYRDCEARGILINAVDQPEICRFITPSIVDRSPVVIAASTGGAVPVLARHLRARLETLIPAGYGDLARVAGEFRAAVKDKLPDTTARRLFWEELLSGPFAERAMNGQADAARLLAQQALATADAATLMKGEVFLVGAGPGDPDLLTFRALRLMQMADVVLYDNLVSDAILDLTRRDADRIYVGKKRADHAVPQEDLNLLLVKLAQEGKKVLRLKGGDPFIFGRGGEEIETLAEHGIPFQVVPGITSAAGASCYAGIPLTHRDYAQGVTFVTGHRREGEQVLDWTRLTNPCETLVVYMGITQAPSIAAELMANGRCGDTPVAIIEKATTPQQKVHIGTLATLGELIANASVKPPALLIIGDVVKLHDKLKWRGDGS